MTVIEGQRNTQNVASVQRAIDLAKPILLLEPDATPLTVISKSVKKGGNVRPTEDFEYSWVEKERSVRFDAINNGAGYTAEATEVKVDTPEVFAAGDLVKNPRTGEIVYVSKVEGEKLTIIRGFSGTTAAAYVDNDPIFVIGAVAEEGSRSFNARSRNPDKITNYTQIFKRSIEASGSWMASGNMTDPHDWVQDHKEQNIEHLLDIEHALLLGGKGKTTGPEGDRLSTTGGVIEFLTANNQDAGGTLTEAEWESFVMSLCRYGNKKTAFVSSLVLGVINRYAVGRLQTIQADKDTTYGISIMEYICAHGTIKLVKHELLEGAVWGGYAIGLDTAQLGYRYLGGKGNAQAGSRDTKLLVNRQENDRDGQKDEILTECGLEVKQIKRGGVLTGVTG